MLGREQGWNLSDERKDVWREYKTIFGLTRCALQVLKVPSTTLTSSVPRYQNNLTKMTQADPPTAFRGGILADDMGIGKTLTMLSLIASEHASIERCCDKILQHSEVIKPMRGTLIVVPLSCV
jgi:SWI/SNF-related matrix-associated actin-dependent regulator of chromatin subfamily A3